MIHTQNHALSPEIVEFLNGQSLQDKQHEAMLLLTVSEEGWPHAAMLSAGEVLATGSAELRIALWTGTQTSANLKRTQQATLVMIHQGRAIYIRLACESLGVLEHARHPRERFLARVAAYREDVAAYADITSGIAFSLNNPAEGLARWAETLEELER